MTISCKFCVANAMNYIFAMICARIVTHETQVQRSLLGAWTSWWVDGAIFDNITRTLWRKFSLSVIKKPLCVFKLILFLLIFCTVCAKKIPIEMDSVYLRKSFEMCHYGVRTHSRVAGDRDSLCDIVWSQNDIIRWRLSW